MSNQCRPSDKKSPSAQCLREQILELVEAYHAATQAESEPFIPGQSVLPYGGRVFGAEDIQAAVGASLDFWLTLGPEGKGFEEELGAYLGCENVLLVNSGSSANLVALSALTSPKLDNPICPGDEVITVDAGFPTTVNPILQNGCIPVFVDVDPDTVNVDVTQLEAALSGKTRAVILAHTLGNPFDIDAVSSFCRHHDLFLIEDNCDALGSRYRGKPTGTFGDFGTSSFYPAHHVTMGEGGAVYTNSARLHRIAMSFRDWGRDCWCEGGDDDTCGNRFSRKWGNLPAGYDHKYVYSHIGYNLKPTDLQAAIGRVQLKRIDAFTAARKRNYAYLAERVKAFADDWAFQQATADSDPSWFGFLLRMRKPDHQRLTRICLELSRRKIGHRRLFAGSITHQPAYLTIDCRKVGDLANTQMMMNGAFFVGVYPGLTDTMLEYLGESLETVLTMKG
ncbi:MAG: lipopolysaccharide biosynthesis protein RfbH [Lentisphaeria bacterium]|nr:lipopolysaccharide biosynthesis protein RfbH [Lentisphaeria bacterium]